MAVLLSVPLQPPLRVSEKFVAVVHVPPTPPLIRMLVAELSGPASIQMTPLPVGTNPPTNVAKSGNLSEQPPVKAFGATPLGHQIGSITSIALAACLVARGTGCPSEFDTTTSVPSGTWARRSATGADSVVDAATGAGSAGGVSFVEIASVVDVSVGGGVASVGVSVGGGVLSSASTGVAINALTINASTTGSARMFNFFKWFIYLISFYHMEIAKVSILPACGILSLMDMNVLNSKLEWVSLGDTKVTQFAEDFVG